MISDRQARLDDLRRRTHPVRTIEPADEDFTDLEGLASAVGDARIVQLGESTHGDGAAFSAKVRLVKFLHQELGFDVLLWESGLYDVWRVNRALQDGEDPLAAARLGIYSIWAEAREVLPLFKYAQGTYRTSRPLEMAGFDLQFSGRDIGDLAEDILRLITWSAYDAGDLAGEVMRQAVNEVVHTYRELEEPTSRNGSTPPLETALKRFFGAVDRLENLVRAKRELASESRRMRDLAVMEQALINLREHAAGMAELSAAGDPAEGPEVNRSWNRRDARMAENVRWLAEAHFRGKKLVVWAHNGHVMNAYYTADWNALSHEPEEGGTKPMGAYLAEWFGEQVYTVAFTAHSGQYELITMPGIQKIEPMPAESLEALLHDLGYEQAFLDFRSLPPDHWLRGENTMAIRGYLPETIQDWTRIIDGVFFIDRMTPPTQVRE